MADQVTTGRFVGRTQELARLHQLVARTANGEPLLVWLGGEAGVGKTRLVEQPAAATGKQGVRVLGVVGANSGESWVLAVDTAEHQNLDELVEDDPVGMHGRWQPSGCVSWCSGSRAANWSQTGSISQAGRAGTAV